MALPKGRLCIKASASVMPPAWSLVIGGVLLPLVLGGLLVI
jgi:hypothetical protein